MGDEQGVLFSGDVCVIVPTYNEASIVADVVSGLRQYFARVVCVDDGSTDGSGEIARAAGATLLRHPVNLGAGAALQTGFEYVLRHPEIQYAVTCDADGQHPLSEVVAVGRRIGRGDVDVVLGSRFLAAGDDAEVPLPRMVLLKLATLFTRITTRLDVTDTHNGLRGFNRDAVACTTVTLRGMAHASQVLHAIPDHDLSFVEHPVHIHYSDYTLTKGQRGLNAFNILCDLAVQRLGVAR